MKENHTGVKFLPYIIKYKNKKSRSLSSYQKKQSSEKQNCDPRSIYQIKQRKIK